MKILINIVWNLNRFGKFYELILIYYKYFKQSLHLILIEVKFS